MHKTMLSPHFSLEKLLCSNLATAKGIENAPSLSVLESLRHLAQILEWVRHETLNDQPLRISSGYRTLQPIRMVDLNDNKQEAVYDGLGRVLATTAYGLGSGKMTGFLSSYQEGGGRLRSTYSRRNRELVDTIERLAIADRTHDATARSAHYMDVLGGYATRIHYDTHCWGEERGPAHAATFVADCYLIGDDFEPEGQARVSIAYLDGLGRTVQSKIKVESGEASQSWNDHLLVQDETLVDGATLTRWLVSGRVEYNNKGQPVCSYQPYFPNPYRYVGYEAIRNYGHYPRHDYDPLGREIKTTRADGYFQRQTFWP